LQGTLQQQECSDDVANNVTVKGTAETSCALKGYCYFFQMAINNIEPMFNDWLILHGTQADELAILHTLCNDVQAGFPNRPTSMKSEFIEDPFSFYLLLDVHHSLL
jgi:hypothetical protein